jgi:cyclic dehypoxanthinyl futalosine synthase
MALTRQQALDCFRSDDLIGLGMEAAAVRRRLHPENVVTYCIGVAPGEEPHSALLPFTTGEDLDARLDHWKSIDTTGLTALIPWPTVPITTADGPTAIEYLKAVAIARMVFDTVDHIGASLAAAPLKVLQMALRFGADDAGHISPDETLKANEQEIRRIIRDAGFLPVERDAAHRVHMLV